MDIITQIVLVYSICGIAIGFLLGYFSCIWARGKRWEKLTKDTALLASLTEDEMLSISTVTVGWLQEIIKQVRKEMSS